jgi:hypothetical protein
MAYLMNTNIEREVNASLSGCLARVGGKVEQAFAYHNCIVEDINVANRRLCKFGTSLIGKWRYRYDLFEQEVRFWRKGYHAVRDRKTYYFDLHDTVSRRDLHKKYNGIMSSNVIEHSYNVIWFLYNMHLLVKDSGYHFHAIPCYRYTFDRFRHPTPLKHFVDDFKAMTTEKDLEGHADEHYTSVLQGDMKDAVKPAYPRIHCHVFDEHNTRELFECMFEEVMVDIIKTDEFRDVLVLCRNTLNPEFKKNYAEILQRYSACPV